MIKKTATMMLTSLGKPSMTKRKQISDRLRWKVFSRDGFRCRYCGASPGQADCYLELDHVDAHSRGGETSEENLITACDRCNGGKWIDPSSPPAFEVKQNEYSGITTDSLIAIADALEPGFARRGGWCKAGYEAESILDWTHGDRTGLACMQDAAIYVILRASYSVSQIEHMLLQAKRNRVYHRFRYRWIYANAIVAKGLHS